MAIQFARIEIVSRGRGGNACCKGAYNARIKVTDEKTNITYNFVNRGDNVYHEILLPPHVDKKFSNVAELMNAIEHSEKKHNSQLVKDIVIALPDDKELSLQDRINITHEIIEEMQWVKQGLAVQTDIHKPHDSEKNWHAHLLVTTRRFTIDGKSIGGKARDLNPEFKTGKDGSFIIPEEDIIHERGKRVINRYFEKMGLENRVDSIGIIPQEHIGPIRMRSILNEAVHRNEEKKVLNIELLKSGEDVLDRVTKANSVFSRTDLERAVKVIPDKVKAQALVEEALVSKEVVVLHYKAGEESGLCTTKTVREEELKLARLSGYIAKQKNVVIGTRATAARVRAAIDGSGLSQQQGSALSHLLLGEGGIRVLKGRAGTGKSTMLGKLAEICHDNKIEVVGVTPSHKARLELEAVGYRKCDTIKGFLFKLYNDKTDLGRNSLIVVDEAGMLGNEDYAELLRVAAARSCNVILAGDERQLSSVGRGRMFEYFADRFGCYELNEIRRQKVAWGREVSRAFSEGRARDGLEVLRNHGKLSFSANKVESMALLLEQWSKSSEPLENRLIITVKNSDVDSINEGARSILKSSGVLTGVETVITKTIGKTADGEQVTKEFGFMVGERIVFTESNKALGIRNGDFGRLVSSSGKEFIVKLDEGKEEVKFNPAEFSGLKPGYASTVYKAQGASVRDVYVLHGGFSTNRNSYVAMSRHINDLRFYTDKESSKTFGKLVSQLTYTSEKGNSIGYFTTEDLQAGKILGATRELSTEEINEEKSLLARVYGKVKEQVGIFVDKHNVNNRYYKFEKPIATKAEVDEILELVHEYDESYKGGIVPGNDNDDGYGDKVSRGKDNESREKAVVGGYEVSKAVGAYNKLDGSAGAGANTITDSNTAEVVHDKNISVQNKATNILTGQGFNKEFNQNLNIVADVKVDGVTTPVINEKQATVVAGKDSDNIAGSSVNSSANPTLGTVTKQKMTSKERFYANRDWQIKRQADIKAAFEADGARLRHEAMFHAERIATDLLGGPNNRLSNRAQLRYGTKGSIIVKISGNSSGTWYDFSEDKGGDIFDLVREVRGCDFKEAAEYLRSKLGISSTVNLKAVHEHAINDKYLDRHKEASREKAQEEAKVRRAEGLYDKSKTVLKNSIAFKYLEGRGIRCDLSGDIKTTGVYSKELGKTLPTLVAFARNSEGKITGGQQIVLDPGTCKKAGIAVPKKSFAKISGSFVEVAAGRNPENNVTAGNIISGNCTNSNITIIAEGLETALSIKQAGIEGKILCSLGVSNIKNYVPKEGERIIIAADNDGAGSASERVIEEARKHLSGNNMVMVVKPKELGDFNDVLVSGGGERQIRELFTPVTNKLGGFSKAQADIIVDYQKYGYKQSGIEEYLKDNKQALDHLHKFNPAYDIEKLKSELEDFTDYTREKLLGHELKKEFKPYAIGKMKEFKNAKLQSNNIGEFLKAAAKEREFCHNMYENHSVEARDLKLGGYDELAMQKETYRQQPKLLEDLKKVYNDAIRLKAYNPELIMLDLQNRGKDMDTVYRDIVFKCKNTAINIAKENLEEIREKGVVLTDGARFTNERAYLEHMKHDKNMKIYVGDYAAGKLAEINKSALAQRLGQYKQVKQQQLAQEQQQKEQQKVKQLEMVRRM